MDDFLLDDEGKLRLGFTSIDKLEQVDIEDGDRSRPTFISAKLGPRCKGELIDLSKEFKDCFTREYCEMHRLEAYCLQEGLFKDSGRYERYRL